MTEFSVGQSVDSEADVTVAHQARIHLIGEMIADPDADIAKVSRLIASEIVEVIKAMTLKTTGRMVNVSSKDLNDQLKAYRELQRTLTESDSLSKRDVLNMDGPKFKFMFGEIVKLFQRALKATGAGDDLEKNVMLQFRDLIQQNEDDLKRELNKIESGR